MQLPSLPYLGGDINTHGRIGEGGFSDLNHLFKLHCHTKCPVPWKFELKRRLIVIGVVVFVASLHAFVY